MSHKPMGLHGVLQGHLYLLPYTTVLAFVYLWKYCYMFQPCWVIIGQMLHQLCHLLLDCLLIRIQIGDL
jgi:hypothetical protein